MNWEQIAKDALKRGYTSISYKDLYFYSRVGGMRETWVLRESETSFEL